MNIKNFLIVLGVGSLILFFGTGERLLASPKGSPSIRSSGQGGWGKLEGELGLSPAQKAQYRGIVARATSKARVIAANRSLKSSAKQAQFVFLRAATFAQVRMILTSAQQVKLNKALAK